MRSLRLLRSMCAGLVLTGFVLHVGSSLNDSLHAAEFEVYRLSNVTPADAKRMLLELTGERAGELHVIADGESNSILIRGPQESRARATQLLEQIDRPAANAAAATAEVIRTYPVAANNRTSTAARLQEVFGDRIRVAADPDGARLIVVAPPEIQEQIAGYLSEMAVPPAPLPPPTRQPSPFPTAGSPAGRADEAAPQDPLHDLRFRLSTLKASPGTISPAQLAFPEDAVTGGPSPAITGAARPTNASYTFQVRSAGEVLQALKRLFADRWQQREAGEYVLQLSGQTALTIRLNPSSAECQFSGPAATVGHFSQLLQQIDAPPSPAGQITRLMQTRRTDNRVLAHFLDTWNQFHNRPRHPGNENESSVNVERYVRDAAFQTLGIQGASPIQLVGQQLPIAQEPPVGQQPPGTSPIGPPGAQPTPSQAPGTEPLRRPTSDVEVQAIPELDVIILRGLGADVEELTRIINEIERLSAETTPQIEVYQLQHVQGVALNQLIADVLQGLAGTLQGRVTITALGKPNALLLIGWGEAVEAAKKLIAELDQPVAPATQVEIFRLEHAPAAQVQTTIQQFYAQRPGLGPQIEITADPRSNSLVVSAAPRDLAEIALLVEQLDVGTSAAVKQARVIHLQNSLAADIAQVLQEAIDAARGGLAPGAAAQRSAVLEMLLVDPEGQRVVRSGLLNDVSVTPDPRTNTLIISGPEASLNLLEVLIGELDETPASSAQIKVFQVINGDATEMVLMLRSLFPAQPGATTVPQLPVAEGEAALVPVRFAVDTRTNSIIATGTSGDLLIIEALLARLDAEEAQERINRVYRLRNSPAIDVAAAINDFLRSERIVQRAAPGRPNPFQQIEQEVVVVPEPVGNALIISASPRYFEDIMEIVKSLDEQPPQVLVQVIIAEVDLDHFHELGFELGLQDSLLFDRSLLGNLITTTVTTSESTASGIVTSTNEVIQAASLTPGFDFNNQPLGNSGSEKSLSTASDVAGQALTHFNMGRVNSDLGYGGLVLSASSENVSVLIRALDHSRHVEILSRPQIMTLDNQPAFIQVGERVPRIVATSINTIGQINTVELEDVGLILGITPRISPDGMVVMDIDAEKSQLGLIQDGIPISVSADGEVVRSPRVEITRAQTTVSAASGQTVVLGGLIMKDHMSMSRKVPWLGDIPLLGALFRYDSNRNERRELLIIMTPHVIRGPEDADYHKQVEMARMSWCTADVYDLLNPGSPPPFLSGRYDETGVPVIYPDQTPGLEWKLDPHLDDPSAIQPMPIRPRHSEPTPHPEFNSSPVPTPERVPEPLNDDLPIPPQNGPTPLGKFEPAATSVQQSVYSVPAASGQVTPASGKRDRGLANKFREWRSRKNGEEASAR